ncbi:MAG: leucine-rich repeat domain-containing protein [Bacteroidales bacterium]|nr:leucine-rich repeat domain-containing protein [Bacteroidales bacterium]
MKRTLLIIFTLLCANVLLAQSTFTIGDLTYGVISTNPPQVEVHDANLSITTANIPETVTYNETTYSVTSIEEWAFNNCSSLNSVTIANSVISIENNAFYNCRSLTYISIGNSLTYIGYDAFYNCSSLNTLNFNAINCNDFYNLSPFFDCPITTINIGDSVQRIPNRFAKELSSLTSVNIGNNVTSIGNKAFEGCSSLQNVTCLATTPPTLADNTVFPYPNIATLNVPCGTLEVYSAPTSFWNMFFAGRIEEDCSGIEQAEAESISFFPNPTKSEITFSQAIEKVEVIDLTGKAILTFTNAKTINIESLPAGAYYLRLTNNDKAIIQKVIKE